MPISAANDSCVRGPIASIRHRRNSRALSDTESDLRVTVHLHHMQDVHDRQAGDGALCK
jgi:hypothetical protein